MKELFSYCDARRISMSRLTTFGSGGETTLVTVNTQEQLNKALLTCSDMSIPYIVLGNGSNCIAHDEGYCGVIIKLKGDFALIKETEQGIVAYAGAQGRAVADATLQLARTGGEFLGCIPTTVGGAVASNCGCYGSSVCQILDRVELTNGQESITLTNKELNMRYHSCLLPDGFVVTKAYFNLKKGNKESIRANLLALRQRKATEQPLNKRSAGSIFARTDGLPPALLIDRANLKGFCIGGAQVSEKHAGFIINKGGASTRDLVAVIDFVTKKIYDIYTVNLVTEIKFLPYCYF